MKCKYLDKISTFLDNELSKNELQEVRQHLKECTECQQELRELQKMNSFLDKYRDEEVPADIINTFLAKNPNQDRINIRKIVNFPIAAMVIVSFVAGIFLSDLAFKPSDDSYAEFGQETFYDYFEGDNDV